MSYGFLATRYSIFSLDYYLGWSIPPLGVQNRAII